MPQPSCLSGEPAVSVAADNLFHPASNIKLFTAAAALLDLGEHFSFATELLCDDPSGGHLWVRGFGDPSFAEADLFRLAASASAAGITGPVQLSIHPDSWADGTLSGMDALGG
eukprot:96273-Prorocentrum_minimum.AAC.1